MAENRLHLDDTVEHWLPGVISGNGNDGSKITVRQVLQHTSGIHDYDISEILTKAGYLKHRLEHHDAAELVARSMNNPPDFPSGQQWRYSNVNWRCACSAASRARSVRLATPSLA